MLKKILLFSCVLSMLAGQSVFASADAGELSHSLTAEAFDLTLNKAQVLSFTDSDGNEVTMGITSREADAAEVIASLDDASLPPDSLLKIGSYSYDIWMTSDLIDVSYTIDVTRAFDASVMETISTITNIYNQSYTAKGGTVLDEVFTIVNAKETYTAPAEAVYALNVELASGTGRSVVTLYARCNGNYLQVRTR